jgi:1-aminocyclopropane-1-carboxylate deaminase/D-cysteine desulfhydrase-like pyridoxal-dependent ACC family enzyme
MLDKGRLSQAFNLLQALPRVKLVTLPTPLEEAKRLADVLGGPRVFIKRDDLCDIALSGTKARMLELRLGRAKNTGADTLIGGWAVQSNHARQIAAAAAKAGMECYLVLRRIEDLGDFLQGNRLLDELLGAKVEVLPEDTTAEEHNRRKQDIARTLKRAGRNPYITGDEDDLNTIGAMESALEMYRQIDALGMIPDYTFFSSANTTHAGILLATKFLGLPTKVIGVHHGWPCPGTPAERVRGSCEAALRTLGASLPISDTDIEQLENYFGRRYGEFTESGAEAITLAARFEGIILDPVYTGKAMAAVIDYVRKEKIHRKQCVAFIHTGGFPALFAYSEPLREYLESAPQFLQRR